MTQVSKIDANVTGLRYSEELSFGTVDPSAVWQPLEPNSYADFGGQITTTPRTPIQPDRQRKKGVTTDLDASGGFNNDLTQTNLQDILQGFFFADFREKATTEPKDGGSGGFVITNVDGVTEEYDTAGDFTASPAGFLVGDLVFAEGFTTAANNGLKRVTAVVPTMLTVAEDLTAEAAPPATASLTAVGFQFASGDAAIDFTGGGVFPALTTSVKDLTELGLKAGEWIHIGGDIALSTFTVDQDAVTAGTQAANGFYRVRSIATNRMEFDKTPLAITVDDSGAGRTIQIFVGRVLQNEKGPGATPPIKRRTYQLERTLGAPDDASTDEHSEYLTGQVPSEFTINIPSADKINVDLSFVGKDHEPTVAGPLKAGTRPAIVEADVFNTSSDLTRFRVWTHSESDTFPTALFAFVQELTLTINNNLTPAKAVGVLGSCEITAGDFQVSGSMTAYFSDIAAMNAVRNNDEVTLDVHLVKKNTGISIDIPLITLGDGRAAVEKDAKITLPLSVDAATGASINTVLDHTLLMVFYDFLPNLADS